MTALFNFKIFCVFKFFKFLHLFLAFRLQPTQNTAHWIPYQKAALGSCSCWNQEEPD